MPEFAVVSQAAMTGAPGQQDFLVSGFGTPKAALFFWTYANTVSSSTGDAMFGAGAMDATFAGHVVSRSLDNVTPSNCWNNDSITILLRTLKASDGTSEATATGALIANGVRLTWASTPPAGYIISCLLIGGAGIVNAKVGYVSTPGALNTATVVNVGFAPDVVIALSHLNSINDSPNTTSAVSVGFSVRGDGQRCGAWADVHAVNPTSTVAALFDTCAAAYVLSGTGGAQGSIEDFTSTGFSFYQRLDAAVQITALYVALQLAPGMTAKVHTSQSPTGAAGNYSITGVGFKPAFGLMVHTANALLNNINFGADSECLSLSLITDAVQACLGVNSDDGVSVSNCESLMDNGPLWMRKDGGNFLQATHSGFTSDGALWNYSQTNGTARYRAGLFISAGPSGGMKPLEGPLTGPLGGES